jgi:hypothetical protein
MALMIGSIGRFVTNLRWEKAGLRSLCGVWDGGIGVSPSAVATLQRTREQPLVPCADERINVTAPKILLDEVIAL